MEKVSREKMINSFKNLEKNFISWANNKDVKKFVDGLKSMKNKRQKQIDKFLTSNIKDFRKGLNKEAKALEKVFKKEIDRTKSAFNNQIKELESIKKVAEKHISNTLGLKKKTVSVSRKKVSAKKVTKKKVIKKKVAKKVSKKTRR